MATFTVLTTANYGAEAIVTQETMQAFYDNVEGLAGGVAPFKILQAAMGAASIGQSQIKTATATGSVSGSGEATIALTGGDYSMWTAGSTRVDGDPGWGGGDTAAGTIGVDFNSISTETFYVDERYFQASPPYDLGDGDVPLFVYLLVNENGEIVGHTEALDPIWVNHGPTCCTPDFYETERGILVGKQYAYDYPVAIKTDREKAKWRRKNPTSKIAVNVDKHADMDVFSHPFVKHDPNCTAIMLDPVGGIIEDLRDAHDAGEDMKDLILKGIKVDNKPLKRCGPKSINIVRATFK